MKRLLSFVLSISLLIACLPLSVIIVGAESKEDTKRYSVLVLDVSDTARFIDKNGGTLYTADSAIDYVKKSADSFLKDLIVAKGDNYVAVVAFAEKASVVIDFTNDISAASKKVTALTSHDDVRDINAGLVAANNLLEKVDSSAVKNVVLVTTGMTNQGKYSYSGHYNEETVGSNWRRTDTNIRLYAYANAAYEAAKTLKENATLYVLGLFHTMENIPEEGKDVAEFFKLTAEDLATSKNEFYDVKDPDELEFAFGEITDDIVSSKGYFKYAGQINKDGDSVAEYYFSDSYFNRSATRYNPSLATMSLCLELSSWSSREKENWYNSSYSVKDNAFWQDKLYNVKTLLLGRPQDGVGYEGIGFTDFKANDFWKNEPTKDSIGVCAARKQITDNKGKKYTLIALVVRGGEYGSEWASNFTIGESGEHDGFATAKNNTLAFLDSYVKELRADESKDIKLWITGYSRAGATANMVAGELNSGHVLPEGAHTSIENVYCYTFEAPQGAVRSEIKGDHSNIFNVLNVNDLVPLVAPYSWGFARYNYQNDKKLPSRYYTNTKDFDAQLAAMEEQLLQLGYPDFKYKIAEESTMKNFKVDKSKFLPFGDPLWWFEESSVDTHTVLEEGVNFLADEVIPSREYYYENLEYSVRQLLGILMDYSGAKDGLNNYTEEVISQAFMLKLDELFTFENITYIVSPMLSLNVFKSYDERVEEVKIRLGKKIGGIFAEYAHIDGFIDAVTEILGDVLVQVANDVWNNNTDSINTVVKVVETLASSKFQGHYPEICLAWCRASDRNYNQNVIETNSTITRLVRINCPVDVNVYDSNNTLVASIKNNVADESIDGIINYVNNKDEKIFFLPGDETYTLIIEATDEGHVNFSLSEYNFNYLHNTRLQNYYDIPVVKGDVLSSVVPAIPDKEFEQNDANGSTVEYQLLHNDELLTANEKFAGEDIEQEYYKVMLDTEGNGGYVDGAGEFIKGSFAKVEAYLLPNTKFLGWYSNDELVSSDLKYRFAVTEDTTVIAKFSDITYSNLDFQVDGKGTINFTEGCYPADVEITLEAVAFEGYEFVGWTSANGGVFENLASAKTMFTMPDKSTTVTAHFKTIEPPTVEYEITVDPAGGIVANDKLKTDKNGKIASLPVPTKDSFDFDGWYTEDGKLVTSDSIFSADSKIIARWKQIPTTTTDTTNSNTNSTTPSSTVNNTAGSPKTGDETNTTLLLFVMLISCSLAYGVSIMKKKSAE